MAFRNPHKLSPLVLAGLLVLSICAVGCADDNPVSPDKMSELRRQEGGDRANFRPNTAPPPPSQGGGTGN